MKEGGTSSVAKAANDDLDAYIASVRAYLARPSRLNKESLLRDDEKPKNNSQRRDESTSADPKAPSSSSKHLAKKHCTKQSS